VGISFGPVPTIPGDVRPLRVRRVGEDRILSLPNVVTTARLVLVPAFVWLLVQPHHRDWWDAAVLLAVLGSTDWVDGQLARRLDQVTNLGKVLDPLATPPWDGGTRPWCWGGSRPSWDWPSVGSLLSCTCPWPGRT
jgi:hypothetical protein